jgi:hypothetical protein
VADDGRCIGFINPYLDMGFLSSSRTDEDGNVTINSAILSPPSTMTEITISRPFFPLPPTRGDEWWRVECVPTVYSGTNNLYQITNLHWDMYVLSSASNLICNRYKIPTKSGIYDRLFIINDVPYVRNYQNLVILMYPILSRLRNFETDPLVAAVDTKVLGNGRDVYQLIQYIRSEKLDAEWLRLTDEYLENGRLKEELKTEQMRVPISERL